jgi:UDP-N-acetylmuramyl tripeptide synthase
MGQAACDLADFSIVTTDNPRTEDPREITETDRGRLRDQEMATITR